MRYEQLRAEYDAAFDRLRAEVCRLQSITQQVSPDWKAEEGARDRGDQALAGYRECRNKLADFLTSRQAAGKPALSVGSPPAGARSAGTDRTARGSKQGAFGHRHEAQLLAYRLWEEAGRPIGNPDEHWHRAEELLGSRQ